MRRHAATAILAGTLVLSAHAQMPANPSQTSAAPTLEIGGEATIDVITISRNALSIPLRHGGVLAGTERIEFRGKILKRGEDYQIDAEAGVIYLMRATREGDVVRVAYRWDKQKEAKASTGNGFAGVAPFKFNLGSGSSLLMGFGVTERNANGNIVQSNIFGWQNSFKFGSAQSKGLLLMGDRNKISNQSDYEFQDVAGETETGSSHFYMQDLALGLGGGKIEVNYQDISKNFAGFSAAQDAGYAADTLNQLRKERGLKRFGLGMSNVALGDLKFNNGFRTVGDGDGSITWQNFGVASGGLSLNYQSQHVDSDFKRFNDLAEKDRGQLKKETGMTRESYGAQFASKASKMSFNVNRIEDPDSSAIERRELKIDTTSFKFEMGDQEVEQDFRRMGSLMDAERAMWGRELGMKRQWMSLQSSLFGASQPLTFSQNLFKSPNGEYEAMDLGISGKGWSLQHTERGADQEFTQFGAMQDGERNGHIATIGGMYEPAGIGFRGEEVHWFNQSSGIKRSVSRLVAQPFKDWNVRFDHLNIAGATDDATVDTFALTGKKFSLGYRRQDLGDQFGEITRLLELERNRLGILSGLERTDFNVSAELSGKQKILYASMSAQTASGGASRQNLDYKDPKLEVSVTTREVDPAFMNSHMLVDPEKDLLASMRGFKQTDIKANWNLSPSLNFQMYMMDSASDSLDQTKYIRDYSLKWNPSKNTALTARRLERRDDDPLSVLFANTIESYMVLHKLNANTTFKFGNESQDFSGTQNGQSDWSRHFFSYETKLNQKTTLTAEASRMRSDDGKKEDVNASTVSTELTKNVGVSYTNVAIDRQGDDHDEKKRGYGFWYDFGNGMRIAYGFAQHRAGETVIDTQNQNTTLTGGNIGNVAVSNGAYTVNQWEGNRTQAMGAIGISTVKPMTILGMTDFKINASIDRASDRAVWLKENQLVGFTGKIGTTGIGAEYRSQIAPNGLRGVDRSFFFTTDQDEKKPVRLNVKYKQRTTPFGETIIIRDYSVTAKLAKNVEVSHNMLTHPEVARGDAILGSITTAKRVNRWKLDVKSGEDTTIGGQWEEQIDQNRPRTRTGGLNVTLFKKSGSPVSLFYGVEQSDPNGVRSTQHRYHLRYDQKPGPNQSLSFFVGNLNTQHGAQPGENKNKISLQLDYQIKF